MSLSASHLGLILLGGVFVWAGVDHFHRFGEVVAPMAERRFPLPRLSLAAGSALEITAGLCLAADIGQPYPALALIAFTLAASVMLLDFWRHAGPQRQALRSAFAINIAVVGGLIVAASSGTA